MRIVLDTNVLVSSLFKRPGPPVRLVGMIEAMEIVSVVSDDILNEYITVLQREKMRKVMG